MCAWEKQDVPQLANLSIFANILKYKVQNALDLVLIEHIAYLQWFVQIFNLNYL